MPLYEYKCESCNHVTEALHKFSDPPPNECPRCHGPLRKLHSAPAIQFKGSGFHITDYAKGGSRSAESNSPSDAAKSDSGSKPGDSSS